MFELGISILLYVYRPRWECRIGTDLWQATIRSGFSRDRNRATADWARLGVDDRLGTELLPRARGLLVGYV